MKLSFILYETLNSIWQGIKRMWVCLGIFEGFSGCEGRVFVQGNVVNWGAKGQRNLGVLIQVELS